MNKIEKELLKTKIKAKESLKRNENAGMALGKYIGNSIRKGSSKAKKYHNKLVKKLTI